MPFHEKVAWTAFSVGWALAFVVSVIADLFF